MTHTVTTSYGLEVEVPADIATANPPTAHFWERVAERNLTAGDILAALLMPTHVLAAPDDCTWHIDAWTDTVVVIGRGGALITAYTWSKVWDYAVARELIAVYPR